MLDYLEGELEPMRYLTRDGAVISRVWNMVERIADGDTDDSDHCKTGVIRLIPLYIVLALAVIVTLGSICAMQQKPVYPVNAPVATDANEPVPSNDIGKTGEQTEGIQNKETEEPREITRIESNVISESD